MEDRPSEIRTVRRPNCLLCGTKGELLYDALADFHFGAPGIWGLKKCPNKMCGLAWLDPFPLEEDIALAYRRYYTHGRDSTEIRLPAKLRRLLYLWYRLFTS